MQQLTARLGAALAMPLAMSSVTALMSCGVKNDPIQCGEAFLAEVGEVTTADVQPILQEHCYSCHSTSKTGTERRGAPASANFDNPDVVEALAEQISFRGGTGEMPPNDTIPVGDQCLLLAWKNAHLLE